MSVAAGSGLNDSTSREVSADAVNDTLLILGASARAAAQSARRAGFCPYAADMFGDDDLRACCPAMRVENYPWGLVDSVRHAPPGEWLYTGALENYPDLIAQLASERPLLGNPSDVLRGVRDPLRIAAVLRAAGLPSPLVALSPEDIPRDGSWLRKRIQSAGGVNIAAWDDACERTSRDVYYQQRISGVPCSAVFVAADGQAVLLGVTRQLIGPAYGAPGEFQYAGSIGPESCAPDALAQWQSIGNALSHSFSLRGLFGVDAVLAEADGRPTIWPVEVNPRYTASIEVLERAFLFHPLQFHVAACRTGRLPVEDFCRRSPPAVVGKQIVFAERDARVSDRFARWVSQLNERAEWPVVADIPTTGSTLAAHAPVATVFARGESSHDVQQSLARLADQLRETLG